MRALNPQTFFSAEQVALRNQLNERLQQGLDQPLAPQLMLANWLFSPPGLLRIANAQATLPAWLLPAYLELYEQVQPTAPAPQLSFSPTPSLPQPDFGVFPASLHELVGNRIQLNRLLGLSNLYYIDPDDQEILQELRELRLELALAIERCPEHDLERFWASDLGDRYWSLVRSGVQKEALTPEEEALKQRVSQRLTPSQGGGFGLPGAINAFLVAMIYFQPGTMQVEAAAEKLPAWLLPHYQQIFAESLAASR